MNQIAVAIATYNGGRRVIRQLDSIVLQTKKPDEIVICDDKSTDNTLDLIDKYRKNHPEIKWKVIQNENNLGYKENFAKAILETDSKYIFLSDQDDYWYKRKIEKMYEAIKSNPKIKVVTCGYNRVGEEDIKNKSIDGYDEEVSYDGIDQYLSFHLHHMEFNEYFYMTHYPGCSFVIDNSCKEWFLGDYWNGREPHDEYLLLYACLLDAAYFLDEQLMYYIRHEDAVTYKKMNNRIQRTKALEGKEFALQLSLQILDNEKNISNVKEKQKLVERQIELINSRIDFLKSPSVNKFIRLIKHICHYEKISYLLGDIYLSMRS